MTKHFPINFHFRCFSINRPFHRAKIPLRYASRYIKKKKKTIPSSYISLQVRISAQRDYQRLIGITFDHLKKFYEFFMIYASVFGSKLSNFLGKVKRRGKIKRSDIGDYYSIVIERNWKCIKCIKIQNN